MGKQVNLCIFLKDAYRLATILGKKHVLNLRFILCVLKTLLLTVYFLNTNHGHSR